MPRQPARASSGRYVSRLTGGTLAVIMAGGRGERLKDLTAHRAKPATPFGGKFRIIDFVLSNCVNSGIRQISILTQYKAQSLIQHVLRTVGQNQLHVLIYGIGSALVPARSELLLRRDHLDKLAELTAQVAPAALHVQDERLRLVLCEDGDLANAGVHAV